MGFARSDEYFILIYEVPSQRVEVDAVGRYANAAADRYSELEEQYRDSEEIEVVLIGADSIETVRRTHSHYFVECEEDLFREFLESAA